MIPFASADCTGVQGADSWEFLDSHSITLYAFSQPLAVLRITWCTVFSLSDICVLGDNLCDGDTLIIDKKACEIREVRAILPAGRNLQPGKSGGPNLLSKDSPEFSADEFQGGLTIKALCHEIERHGYAMEFTTQNDTIERLNEILRTPNFYDMYMKKTGSPRFSEYVRKLASKSKSYRNRKFSELSQEELNGILKLNRAILEESYPKTCPKVLFSKVHCSAD